MNAIASSNSKMRHHLFFRSQFLAAVGLVLCTSIGLGLLHALLPSSSAKTTLIITFIAISMIVAGTQLISIYIASNVIVRPLERFMKVLQDYGQEVASEDAEGVSVDRIRATLTTLQQELTQYQHQWPAEIQQMQTIFVHTLKTMEKMWSATEADLMLIGMGKMCSQVAHDMRTPLTTMKVFLRHVPIAPDNVEMVQFRAAVAQSCERLNDMANELLTYRKSDAVEKHPIDLAAVVTTICREIGLHAKERRVTVDCSTPATQDFFGDAAKLGRVLQNLVSNAVQAVEHRPDGHVSVCVRKEHDHIAINICDNGKGIADAHLGQMFKTSFSTKKSHGNGLGLIYCANVVKAHGGQITASNRASGGAEISLILPHETLQ